MLILTTPTLVRSEGNFQTTITDAQINPFITASALHVSESITDYNQLWNDCTGSEPTNIRAFKARRAETYFALSYAVVPLNTRTHEKGGMITSVGFGEGKEQLLTFEEANEYKNYYANIATDIMNEIYNASASDAAESSGVAYSASFVAGNGLYYGCV